MKIKKQQQLIERYYFPLANRILKKKKHLKWKKKKEKVSLKFKAQKSHHLNRFDETLILEAQKSTDT